MSDKFQTAADMGAFNRCLICQVAISKGSFSNSKLCQKFLTLASRYYNIEFPQNLVNLHKTLTLRQLKADSDSAKLISCDNCFHKINTFCEIHEEVSFLQIHLDASARKITELIEHSNNRNNGTVESGIFDCFRNQFHSKVSHHFPHVKLRRLEIDDVSTIENDPLYIPIENENSGDEDKSDNVQIDQNHISTEIGRAVLPTPSKKPGTELTHQAKVNRKTKASNKISTEFQNLAADSSSSSATGNAVEILKTLPQGSLVVFPGKAEPERRHKCRFCDKAFKTRHNKNSHENTHLQPYQCRFCSRTFSFRCTMTVHERTHTGIKPFKCSVCAETFREKRRCTTHVWLVHKGNGEVISDSKQELESNLVDAKIEPLAKTNTAQNSQDAEKPFKCSICLKDFAKLKSLTDHERIHSRPFKCETCGARFASKFALEIHTRSHTGERPYLCSICFQTFLRHSNCRIHQRNVHKIPNGVIINTINASGVWGKNRKVTPGNQTEPKIQENEKSEYTNGEGENFILPDTKQEFEMDFEDNEVTIGDIKPVYPFGEV